MKIVFINSTPRGSTGTIVNGLVSVCNDKKIDTYMFFGRKKYKLNKNQKYFGSRIENHFHRLFSFLTGISGIGSYFGTKKLLRKIRLINPDVIHLHNLHGWYVNIPLLFKFIKKKKIRTIWTFHDCWPFTAQCAHFTIEKCDKWINGCYSCPRLSIYPNSFFDNTRTMWKLKKRWLTGVQNMTIVTPSQWLSKLVRKSFLNEYDVITINNGIDSGVFAPTDSDFRIKNSIADDECMILGVASEWTDRKGIDVFVDLAEKLSSTYKIVLVGTNEGIDKSLPESVISVHRTSNQSELVKIYSAADVFVNPTREDNFPTVNLESLACGTPVITFNTGGSPEIIDESCGLVVPVNDIDRLKKAIERVFQDKPYSRQACVNRARMFEKRVMYEEYVKLYGK